MYSDLTVDYLKVTLLNAPAVLLVRSPDRTASCLYNNSYLYHTLPAACLRDSMQQTGCEHHWLYLLSSIHPFIVASGPRHGHVGHLPIGVCCGAVGQSSTNLCAKRFHGFTQVLGLLFSIDDITGFEITKVIELPKPYGIVFLWGLVLPSLFILANAITSLVFKDALILKVRGPGSSWCFAAHAA
jgi:hypothetical protein